jgi:hypothetical protein
LDHSLTKREEFISITAVVGGPDAELVWKMVLDVSAAALVGVDGWKVIDVNNKLHE